MKAMVAALAGGALVLVGALTASRPVSAAVLTPGTYGVSAFTTSFTTRSGNFCFPAVYTFGWTLSFHITYNGAGRAATATIQVPANPTATPGPFVALLSLPPTPNGTNIWTGRYTEKLLPVGGAFSPQTFTATLRVTSTRSFLGTMTLNGFSSGPGQLCDISFQYAAVFVGPLN